MSDTPNAVVCGYGPGNGAAIARALAAEGYSLALIARDAAKLEAAAAVLPTARGFAADGSDVASLTAALAGAREAFGDPDVLVYNPSIWRPGPALGYTVDQFEADLRLHITGAFAAAQVVAPAMVARKRGSILFTGGGLALHPSATAPLLSIGKAAIRSLALVLAEELAPAGVRVGTVTVQGVVAPGTAFDPDLIAQAFIRLHRGTPDPATAEIVFG